MAFVLVVVVVVIREGGGGNFIARLTSSVRMTPSFSPSKLSTSFRANIFHASLVSASSSAEMSLSTASLLRRVLAGGLPLEAAGVAAGRFLGGWYAETVTAGPSYMVRSIFGGK